MSAPDQDLELLIRKLNYHEAILDKLLAGKGCAAINSVRANFLERKMVRFEEMVLEIPEDGDPYNRELFDEWFDAVVQMWDRFLLAASSGADVMVDGGLHQQQQRQQIGPGGDVVQPTSTTTTTSNKKRLVRNSSRTTTIVGGTTVNSPSTTAHSTVPSPVAVAAAPRASTTSVSLVIKNLPKSSAESQQKEQQPKSRRIKQTYRNMNFRRSETASAKSEASPVVVAEPIPKETLSAQLEAAFDKLTTVEQMSDLEAMQALLTEVARGVKHISPYREDTELQAELLGHVLPKLPEEVVERFETRAEEEQEKTLHLLKKCLIDELTDYYNELKEAAADASTDGEGGENSKTCYYCKALGHLAYECPQAKTMLCYRCWKNGHKARDCGKRCHKCGRLGHYQKHCKSKM